jgi:hypothetical protein
MAGYRIILDGQVVPDDNQVYHQIGELPWRLAEGAAIRIDDRSYRVDHVTWRQDIKELALEVTPLGSNPAAD